MEILRRQSNDRADDLPEGSHLLLATLVQRVSFELASQGKAEPDPYHTVTIRPMGGLPVIVKRRELRSQESSE